MSELNNTIVYNGSTVELYRNDFSIYFTLMREDVELENSADYITNNKLGIHTINMTFDWNDLTQAYASLDARYAIEYNLMGLFK